MVEDRHIEAAAKGVGVDRSWTADMIRGIAATSDLTTFRTLLARSILAHAETLARVEAMEAERGEQFNEHGLLPCPECGSAAEPYLYWWNRGQAWIAICGSCKHEANARESHEFRARDIWNDEARAASIKPKDAQP